MPQHNEQDPLAPFQQRRQRNLAYLKKVFPAMYRRIKDVELASVDLIIKPSRSDVDLKVDGKSLYHGRARAAARHEVKTFCILHDSGGKMNRGNPPLFYQNNEEPAFAHRHLAEISQQSPLKPGSFDGYTVDGFYPLVVFMGCGLGYQIQAMLERRTIQQAVVFEPNPEIFAASLYTIDWGHIRSQLQSNGGELEFCIGQRDGTPGHEEELKRRLIRHIPLFPNGTQYFLHRGGDEMRPLLEWLAKDLQVQASIRNGYDDLVIRFNNAVHCLSKRIPLIPPKNSIPSSKPVLIAGSGPSIDDRLDDIRAVREHVLLVTAGTGLDGLLANGIRPDIHLELDPGHVVYRRHNLNAANVKNIRFMGSLDVYPSNWDVFGEGRLFIPQGNPVSPLAGAESQHIPGTGTTCTNAALAVLAQLGFTQVFLFGTDYGFREHDKHHSIHSAIYASDDKEIQNAAKQYGARQFGRNATFEVESTDGRTCYTNSTFYMAKADTEAMVKQTRGRNANAQFYNCSDGAHIKGTKWLSGSDFINTVTALPQDEDGLDKLFSSHARPVSRSSAEAKMNRLYQLLPVHMSNIEKLVNNNALHNRYDMTHVSAQIINYVDNFQKKTQNKDSNARRLAAWLTKNEMLNFTTLGFTHAMALDEDDDVKRFLNTWANGVTQFLEALPEDFKEATKTRQ